MPSFVYNFIPSRTYLWKWLKCQTRIWQSASIWRRGWDECCITSPNWTIGLVLIRGVLVKMRSGKLMARMVLRYMGLLSKKPVQTKAITAALLNLIGDIFTQMIVEKTKKLDYRRVASMAILGIALVGPVLHYWYNFMNKTVKVQGATGAAMRLFLDQVCFAPFFIALTFALLLLMEGRQSEIKAKLAKDLQPTIIANWKLWIPFQFCNFMFVPPALQVLFANSVSLVWNVYLSFASHKGSSGSQMRRSDMNKMKSGMANNQRPIHKLPQKMPPLYRPPQIRVPQELNPQIP